MALKVKAVERLLKFDKESAGKYRYVMKADLYTSLTQAKVIKEAALRSGVSQGACCQVATMTTAHADNVKIVISHTHFLFLLELQ